LSVSPVYLSTLFSVVARFFRNYFLVDLVDCISSTCGEIETSICIAVHAFSSYYAAGNYYVGVFLVYKFVFYVSITCSDVTRLSIKSLPCWRYYLMSTNTELKFRHLQIRDYLQTVYNSTRNSLQA